MGRRLPPSGRMCVAMVFAGLVLACAAMADPADPLLPLLHRMESYFRREEIDGITSDARYSLNPAEVIRLSIVSQLLAFNELAAVDTLRSNVLDVKARADFLIEHLSEIRSGSAFDGMLGYALLGAYEITGDARYFDAGGRIAREVMRYRGNASTLNWGLMSAMATAKYYAITGDEQAFARTESIVSSLSASQHSDGSFPHYCAGSKDVHYTAWMGMELIHVRRHMPSPVLDEILGRVAGFLSKRVTEDGRTSYQNPCTLTRTCAEYYFSRASGCAFDYDTRGWINELGYTGLVLDVATHASFGGQSPSASSAAAELESLAHRAVMSFLYDLEDHGAVSDKWDYLPVQDDPIYVWSVGNPSVIRSSVVFWSLATAYRERMAPRDAGPGETFLRVPIASSLSRIDEPDGPELPSDEPWRRFEWTAVDRLVLEGADPETVCAQAEAAEPQHLDEVDAPDDPRRMAAAAALPVEARGRGVAIRFALAASARVTLEIFDLSGRRLVGLDGGHRAAGEHEITWSGEEARGPVRSPGVYFARLRAAPGGVVATRRFALLP